MSEFHTKATRAATNQAAIGLAKLNQAEDLIAKAAVLNKESQELLQNAGPAAVKIAQDTIVGVKAKLEHKEAAYAWLRE